MADEERVSAGVFRYHLKSAPPYFEPLLTGVKTFDVRRREPWERQFTVGDEVMFREWGDDGYTGRQILRRIVYILSGPDAVNFGLQRNVVVLGLAP
jgi:hypothetical protein